MNRQRRLLALLAFFLVLVLVVTACERPFTGSDEGTADRGTDVGTGIAVDVPTQAETNETDTAVEAPPAAGEQTGQSGAYPPPAQEESAGQETVDIAPQESADTPRVEPSAEATPMLEAPTSEETATETAAGVEAESAPAEQPAAETGTKPAETGETETAVAEPPATHTVVAGENLYRIGLKYGISWVTLAQINKLADPNNIKVGQVLQLSSTTALVAEPTPSPLTETTYTVRRGDTLFRIGLAYGINWVQIAEANGIVNPNQIFAGQVLKIPVQASGPAPQFTHTVKAGETLYLISLQYGVAWPTIAAANKLESPYVIYVGQTLVIPGGG